MCSLWVKLLKTGFQRNVSWQLFPIVLFIMVLVQLFREFVNEILRQIKAPEQYFPVGYCIILYKWS